MQLKISSFKPSLPVMRKNFTRFWPIWGSYLAIWLLILPPSVLRAGLYEGAQYIRDSILVSGRFVSVGLSVIYGFLSAAAVWSYLYNHRSVSLYHSLPVSREGMFLSHFLSGLGFMILPNLVICGLTWLACVGQGAIAASSVVWAWLGAVCLQNLFYFCFATLLAMLTGSLATHAVIYGILNLACVLCEMLLRLICGALIYGVYGEAPQFTFLSPPVHMIRVYMGNYPNELPMWDQLAFSMLLRYALAGLVLAILALLLYRKRDSERAGDVIAVPFLRPVAKYCFALGCALVLGFLFNLVIFEGKEGFIPICASLLLGGLIGYLAAAMLLKKSFRVFDKRNVLGFCALALVIVGCLTCMKTDLFRVGRWLPRPGQVKTAVISSLGESLHWDEEDDPAELLDLFSVHRALSEEQKSDPAYATDVYLTYTLKSGRTVERRYQIDTSNASLADPSRAACMLRERFNDPDNLLKNILPPEGSTVVSIELYIPEENLNPHGETENWFYLNTDEFRTVVDALRADVTAGDYGGWRPQETDYSSYHLEISYAYPGTDSGSNPSMRNDYCYLDFAREEAPRTFKALCELGYLMPIGGMRP